MSFPIRLLFVALLLLVIIAGSCRNRVIAKELEPCPCSSSPRSASPTAMFPLLDHANLVVEPGERIGLIGRNGAGKSSLLCLIEGAGRPDDGTVWSAPGLALASVPQEPAFPAGESVFETVAGGVGAARRLIVDYHAAAHAGDLERMQALHEVRSTPRAHGPSSIASRRSPHPARIGRRRVRRIALGRHEEARGARPRAGRRSRAAPARRARPTIWTSAPSSGSRRTLVAFAGAALFVTHDRRFLDRVATRIVELDRGRLASFPGNFAAYEARKAEMLANEAVVSRKFDKVLAQEEAWIRKGVEARRTRNEGRVRRLTALREERAARRERVGRVDLALSAEASARASSWRSWRTWASCTTGAGVVDGFLVPA